jgi:hypothetical protein
MEVAAGAVKCSKEKGEEVPTQSPRECKAILMRFKFSRFLKRENELVNYISQS